MDFFCRRNSVIDCFVEQIWLLEFIEKIGIWVLWHKFRKKWFQIYVETLFFLVVPCSFCAMNLASRRKWPSWLRSLLASVTQLQRCGLHIAGSCHQIPCFLVSRSIYTSILQVAVLLQLFKCEPWLEFVTPNGNFGKAGSCYENKILPHFPAQRRPEESLNQISIQYH